MKKSVYQENAEKSIKRQLRWMGFDDSEERELFLDNMVIFCEALKDSQYKPMKVPKTRHGSGKS